MTMDMDKAKLLWDRAASARTSAPEEVEAGAEALFFECYGDGWGDATDADKELCRQNARAVLNAAIAYRDGA